MSLKVSRNYEFWKKNGSCVKPVVFNAIEEHYYETTFSKNTKSVFSNSGISCLNYSMSKMCQFKQSLLWLIN